MEANKVTLIDERLLSKYKIKNLCKPKQDAVIFFKSNKKNEEKVKNEKDGKKGNRLNQSENQDLDLILKAIFSQNNDFFLKLKEFMKRNNYYFDLKDWCQSRGLKKSNENKHCQRKSLYLYTHFVISKRKLHELINKHMLLDGVTSFFNVFDEDGKSNSCHFSYSDNFINEYLSNTFSNSNNRGIFNIDDCKERSIINTNIEKKKNLPLYINNFKTRKLIEDIYEEVKFFEKTFPKGTKHLSFKEKERILFLLKERKESLLTSLRSQPISFEIRSLSIRKKQENIERLLRELDCVIEKFEKGMIFISEV